MPKGPITGTEMIHAWQEGSHVLLNRAQVVSLLAMQLRPSLRPFARLTPFDGDEVVRAVQGLETVFLTGAEFAAYLAATGPLGSTPPMRVPGPLTGAERILGLQGDERVAFNVIEANAVRAGGIYSPVQDTLLRDVLQGAAAATPTPPPVTIDPTVANWFFGSSGLHMPRNNTGAYDTTDASNQYGYTRRLINTTWARQADAFIIHNIAQHPTAGVQTPAAGAVVTVEGARLRRVDTGEIINLLAGGQPVTPSNPLTLNAANGYAARVDAAKALAPNTAYFVETWDVVPTGTQARLNGNTLGSAEAAVSSAASQYSTSPDGLTGAALGVIHLAKPAVMTTRDDYRSVLIIADSTEDQNNFLVASRAGHIRRALDSASGGRIAYFGMPRFSGTTVGGMKTLGLAIDGTGNWFMPLFTSLFGTQTRLPFSVLLGGHYRNDGTGSQPELRRISREATARVKLSDPKCVVGWVAPWPYATSTDGWATEANQTNAGTTRSGFTGYLNGGGDGQLGGGVDFLWDLRAFLATLGAGAVDVWPQTNRQGTLVQALAIDSANPAVLRLDFAPNVGDVLTVEPGVSGQQERFGMVASVSGSASPYIVTLISTNGFPNNRCAIAHAAGVAVRSTTTFDGTHEAHVLLGPVADWECTQKPLILTAEAAVDAPVQVASDLFNDASGVLLSAHVPDSGGSWAADASYTPANGVLVDGGNAIYSGDAASLMVLSTALSSADYSVEATLNPLSAVTNDRPTVCARVQPNGNRYEARWNATNSTWELRKVVGGTATVLASVLDASQPRTWATDQSDYITASDYRRRRKLRLTVKGSTITLSLGNTKQAAWIATATDTSMTAAGKAGVRFEFATTATTGVHIEDLRVATA